MIHGAGVGVIATAVAVDAAFLAVTRVLCARVAVFTRVRLVGAPLGAFAAIKRARIAVVASAGLFVGAGAKRAAAAVTEVVKARDPRGGVDRGAAIADQHDIPLLDQGARRREVHTRACRLLHDPLPGRLARLVQATKQYMVDNSLVSCPDQEQVAAACHQGAGPKVKPSIGDDLGDLDLAGVIEPQIPRPLPWPPTHHANQINVGCRRRDRGQPAVNAVAIASMPRQRTFGIKHQHKPAVAGLVTALHNLVRARAHLPDRQQLTLDVDRRTRDERRQSNVPTEAPQLPSHPRGRPAGTYEIR